MCRIVSISDTHSFHHQLDKLPEGDIITHSGDFSHNGTQREVLHFLRWLEKQPYKHKLICPGNHDLICEQNYNFWKPTCEGMGITYLCDEEVTIEGLKFFGSPYTKFFGGMAFEKEEIELVHFFSAIPEDVDVLITHGPPYGLLDKNSDGKHCGSKALSVKLHYTNVLKLKLCVFGHIHEGYGYEYHNYGLPSCSSVNKQALYANVALAGAREYSWRKYEPGRVAHVHDIK